MTERFRDSRVAPPERARDLLSRMTLHEKIGQMNQPLYGWRAFRREGDTVQLTDEFRDLFARMPFGAMYGLFRADPWSGMTQETGLPPRLGPKAANRVQRYAIEHTRFGIPLLLSEETPHGHMALGGTVLPTGILLACTWDRELAERAGAVAAAEARAFGAHLGFGPVLDIARDPRWGRVEEGFGEDPRLTAEMGAAMVRGLQGKGPGTPGKVVATLKHFTAYGSSEGGHNAGPVHAGPRDLREMYLPAFRAGVRAGAGAVLAAYNEIDGIPCHTNRALLTGILREEWGFDGVVVSEGNGIDSLAVQRAASTHEARAARALHAGVDLSLWDEAYLHLERAVEQGLISAQAVDRATYRILLLKFRLGLFEQPYVDEESAAAQVGCAAHVETAYDIARDGVVLLENRNGILPLKRNLRRIAVIGPNADNVYNQLGDYTAPQAPGRVSTVLSAIRATVGSGTEVLYARGCRVKDPSRSGFADALDAAHRADAIVAVVGGSSARDFDGVFNECGQAVVQPGDVRSDMECGEGFDHHSLELSGVQTDLLRELKRTGKPLIVILIHGRPYAIPWIAANADALLAAWYSGQEGGRALADLLFGDANPCGKLPISFPKHAGQVPVYYNRKSSARPNYVFLDAAPLYPFGYGLSYTTFAFGELRLSRETIRAGESCEASVTVTNTGPRAGKAVIQLYVRDEESTFTRPARELKDFRKIALEPGESAGVRFQIGPDALAYPGEDLQPWVEPGTFAVLAGDGPAQLVEARLTVLPGDESIE